MSMFEIFKYTMYAIAFVVIVLAIISLYLTLCTYSVAMSRFTGLTDSVKRPLNSLEAYLTTPDKFRKRVSCTTVLWCLIVTYIFINWVMR